MMDNYFRDLTNKGHVVIYMDDILIHVRTKKEPEIQTKQVLDQLKKHDLYLKLSRPIPDSVLNSGLIPELIPCASPHSHSPTPDLHTLDSIQTPCLSPELLSPPPLSLLIHYTLSCCFMAFSGLISTPYLTILFHTLPYAPLLIHMLPLATRVLHMLHIAMLQTSYTVSDYVYKTSHVPHTVVRISTRIASLPTWIVPYPQLGCPSLAPYPQPLSLVLIAPVLVPWTPGNSASLKFRQDA